MGCHHVKTRFYRVHFIGSSLLIVFDIFTGKNTKIVILPVIFFRIYGRIFVFCDFNHKSYCILRATNQLVDFSADSTSCFKRQAVVILPTPLGTGVMASTTSATSSKLTSPTSLPLSVLFMPTSIIIWPL